MKTMKAYVRTNSDNQEVKLMDVPIPEIQANEVLIKVEAFGVGIHDRYFIPDSAKFPYVIGSEGAGTIEALGAESIEFSIGDRVIFSTVLQPQGGSWAEYAVAKCETLMALPNNMSYSQGAAIPVAGRTALESMNALNLKEGEDLFIAGASGAIGSLVIQLAKSKLIHVSASASEENQNFMQSLGADKTVDYNDENWQKRIKHWSGGGVTAALAIQPGTAKVSLEVVKDGGRLITVSGDHHQVIPERSIDVKQIGHHDSTRKQVLQLVDDISKRKIKLVIEREYPFLKALEALEKTETRHARGKSVVTL